MNAPCDRVPITVLSGFLGSGKTTLLNHIRASVDPGQLATVQSSPCDEIIKRLETGKAQS